MKISDAEWRVMRVIWGRRGATAAEVIEELLPETGWNHRTVRTLLGRLVEKGALAAKEGGHPYVYRSKVSQAQCIRQETRSFLDKVFDGDAVALLVHFVQNDAISPEQIHQLRRLLEEKGKEEE